MRATSDAKLVNVETPGGKEGGQTRTLCGVGRCCAETNVPGRRQGNGMLALSFFFFFENSVQMLALESETYSRM